MSTRAIGQLPTRTIALTGFCLIMFASNSLLCRMALGTGSIDAASFSAIRMISGSAVLLLIMLFKRRSHLTGAGDMRSALFLFLYAVPFSFAYTGLSTGTGALILFGAVQITMLLSAWMTGERPALWQWIGASTAAGGLLYLLLPGLQAPPVLPALWMTVAGVAWGLYSVRGRRKGDPLLRTFGNFVRTIPLVLAVSLITLPMFNISGKGVALAVGSGACASAIGYLAWYVALNHLSGIQASVFQLLVPVIAAVAGVLLLGEVITMRLVIASMLVLGGISLQIRRRPT